MTCHEAEVQAFTGSDHDLAMDHATAETVLGDFGDVVIVRDGVETRFATRDGRFFVTTDGPEGSAHEYEVLYTFGVRPLQQYLVQLDAGRVQRLPWSWDSRPAEAGGQRWFHVYGDRAIASDDVLHWTRPSQNWNRMCADCHSTDLDKAYDPDSGTYRTTWSEIDVSCEACHGPASRHLAWARGMEPDVPPLANGGFPVRLSDADDAAWSRRDSEPTARRSRPRTDDSGLEACARCHSHRAPIAEHVPGAPFTDLYRLSLPREPLYHSDGQVDEEVFVYGSFLQSRMYAAGVECGDCHDPHTATLRAEGNALCLRCHAAAVFDTRDHHRHDPGAPGSSCVDCHMPPTSFMQVDARRDHGFRIPRPALDEAPNACTSCHEGRDAPWVRAVLDAWYGAPADSSRLRTARVFQAAARYDPSAAADLHRIATDTARAAIVRATAVSYLDRYPSERTVSALRAAALDVDPLVRAEAARALRVVEPAARVPIAAPLLADPSRLVRIAAARTLAPAPRNVLGAEPARALARASAEFEASRWLNADDPAANVELGDYRAERGSLPAAEEAYRRAIRLEPGFAPAYLNLADLYRALDREPDGRDVLTTGRSRAPDEPMLAYALGLLEVRAGRLQHALAALEQAVILDPSDARFVVALGLALQRVGRPLDAIAALEASLNQVSDRSSVLLTLVSLHTELGMDEEALRRARELVAAYPQVDEFRSFLTQIEERAGG